MKQLFVMPPLPNMMKIKVQIKKNCWDGFQKEASI